MQISSPPSRTGAHDGAADISATQHARPAPAAAPKKRIALMLSGLPRQWRVSLQSQLFSFRHHQVDVFFHFWDTIDAAEKDEIVALLQPRAHIFETPRDFLSEDKNPLYQRDNINMPSRLFSQYYSWREVAKLMEPHKADYDLAVRSRSDLNFVRDIEAAALDMKPNDILLPQCRQKEKQILDLLAFGDVDAILYYHKMIDSIQTLAQERLFNPELMLKAHLDAYPDIRILTIDNDYFFVRRAHMKGYSAGQALLEDPRLNKWLDPEIVSEFRDLHQRADGDAGAKQVEAFSYSQAHKLVSGVAAKVSDIMAEKAKAAV